VEQLSAPPGDVNSMRSPSKRNRISPTKPSRIRLRRALLDGGSAAARETVAEQEPQRAALYTQLAILRGRESRDRERPAARAYRLSDMSEGPGSILKFVTAVTDKVLLLAQASPRTA